jgi:hypothetical protein
MLTAQRYQNVMNLKRSGKLIDRVCKCPDSNFRRNFLVICKRAGLDDVSFHDLRSTCITEWMEQGMMPHEVQRLAGHSSIETTMNYYVGIRESMLQRARQASRAALGADFGAHLARTPENDPESTKKAAPECSQHPDTAVLTNTRGNRTSFEPLLAAFLEICLNNNTEVALIQALIERYV